MPDEKPTNKSFFKTNLSRSIQLRKNMSKADIVSSINELEDLMTGDKLMTKPPILKGRIPILHDIVEPAETSTRAQQQASIEAADIPPFSSAEGLNQLVNIVNQKLSRELEVAVSSLHEKLRDRIAYELKTQLKKIETKKSSPFRFRSPSKPAT